MKVGVVGAGQVGSTAAYAMVMNGVGREIVMVDVSRERAQAQADDISHAIPFSEEIRAGIDRRVRFAGRSIIAGKGATNYGIGSALARIVDVILLDQRAILTVCTPQDEVAGVKDVTVSLPHLVGGRGVIATLPISLSPEETSALRASAQTVREAIASLDS
jgi:malate/lactate dehydrogenase